MDINLDLVREIISSDEMCDKANSLSYRDSYIKKIEEYILFLVDDIKHIDKNIEYINRYLRKFVINSYKREDIIFNRVFLKLYSLNIDNKEFSFILDSFKFNDLKDEFVKKYDQIIINKSLIDKTLLSKMLNFYAYIVPNFKFNSNYISYFIYYIDKYNYSFSYDLIVYFYKQIGSCFADLNKINVSFLVREGIDPYYDNKNSIVLDKSKLSSNIDFDIISDILFQVNYINVISFIGKTNNLKYSFLQLRLVKELSLISILGKDYYFEHYYDSSVTNYMKCDASLNIKSFLSKIGINYNSWSFNPPLLIDVLFDEVISHENPNLIMGLIKSYPILGSEYKNYKKKSLLSIMLDLYYNQKLLINLNRDLSWYRGKIGSDSDSVILPKIERLVDKVSVCSSYIDVLTLVINKGDMSFDDLMCSISDLITYNTSDVKIQNDICIILENIIPKKIERLYKKGYLSDKDKFKKKIIKCYTDSLSLVSISMESDYFIFVLPTVCRGAR